nr:hypothetical protein [Salmonella enterica]
MENVIPATIITIIEMNTVAAFILVDKHTGSSVCILDNDVFPCVVLQDNVTVSSNAREHVQPGVIDIAHFEVIGVNINHAIRTADKSAVTVADVYTRCTTVKNAGSYVTDTDAFCRIEGFF